MQPISSIEQLMQDFERHRVELDDQMQRFMALQSEVESVIKEASKSPQASQKLARLQQLEQSDEYIQLRDQTLAKLEQLEAQFVQMSHAFEPAPSSQRKPPKASAQALPGQHQPTPRSKKKSVRRFV